MFTGREPPEICLEILGFYGKISGESMEPLPEIEQCPGGEEDGVQGGRGPLPKLGRQFPFAEPVALIYDEINDSGSCPRAWQTKYFTIIPKVPNPSSLSECRNISCTLIFSNILEGTVLLKLWS